MTGNDIMQFFFDIISLKSASIWKFALAIE